MSATDFPLIDGAECARRLREARGQTNAVAAQIRAKLAAPAEPLSDAAEDAIQRAAYAVKRRASTLRGPAGETWDQDVEAYAEDIRDALTTVLRARALDELTAESQRLEII